MPRDYHQIQMDIAIAGFFSEYLPPCFKLDRHFFCNPPAQNCDLIPPVCFTMSRYNGNDSRRNIFLPEIGCYNVAQQYMNEKHLVQELIEFSETSSASFSPILGDDDGIVRHEQSYQPLAAENQVLSSNYVDNVAQKIIRSAGAKQVLKLDISNCFSSFYMHMIPAIILGMEDAEAEYNKYIRNTNDTTVNPLYLKYRQLDSILRRQNLNRTNGLLTGTLYSKIIAEAILARVDKELVEKNIVFSRYVDDYDVYLYGDEGRQIISIFEKILKRYGFTLNSEKTELVDFPHYVTENLEQIFRGQIKESLTNAETIKLFNSFFYLEKAGTKGAIRFLLKSIEKNQIEVTDYTLYKSYLLTILSNNERSLTKSCTLLLKDREHLELTQRDVNFIVQLLHNHLKCEHDLETIWLTYLLTETGKIEKGDDSVSSVVASNNELAQLLLLQHNLLLDSQLELIRNKASSWILLYELYSHNHITENAFVSRLNIKANLSMYQHFKEKNLHFCVQ